MPKLPAKQKVRDLKQVQALSGPLQHQIMATMERVGSCTANELGGHLGVAPESLYYHLRKLKRVGLLVEREKRRTARRPEAVFAMRGRELVLDPHDRRPRFCVALIAMQRSLMAMAMRLYGRAVVRKESVRAGPRRNLCIIQQHARLGPRDLAELNRRLEAVATFVAENDDPSVKQFVSLTVSMSPVLRER